METSRSPAHVRRHAIAALLAALLLAAAGLQPAVAADAADNAAEREMLAAVTRQLELLDRLAEREATTAPQERTRYHFDYARLRADLQRMRRRADYLFPSAPSRAIPCRWPATTRARRGQRQGGAVAMTPSADQVAAFQANGGFAPAAVSTVVLGFVFAVLLLWGVWAMRTAYVGWAEHHLTQRQFLGVIVRFVAMYLVLGFFLLS